jgi:hypothetical protein
LQDAPFKPFEFKWNVVLTTSLSALLFTKCQTQISNDVKGFLKISDRET